jgi:hypothetical protein
MPFLVFVAIAVVTAAARLPLEHGLTVHRVLELFLLHALVVVVGLGGLFAFSGHVFRGREWRRESAGLLWLAWRARPRRWGRRLDGDVSLFARTVVTIG